MKILEGVYGRYGVLNKTIRVLELCLFFNLGLVFFATAVSASTQFKAGDIVVLDSGVGGADNPGLVFKINPINGSRELLNHLKYISWVIPDQKNDLIFVNQTSEASKKALYRIDFLTGDRTLIADFDAEIITNSRILQYFTDLAIEKSGSLLVLMRTLERYCEGQPGCMRTGTSILYRVNLETGAKTIVTDFTQLKTDPNIPVVVDTVTVDSAGKIIALTTPNFGGIGALYSIEPDTGKPTLFSVIPKRENLPEYQEIITSIAAEKSGDILATSFEGPGGRLFRVNRQTGEFKVLSDFYSDSAPIGTNLFYPVDVAVESSGKILVLDPEASPASSGVRGSLWRIDPQTGDRAILSDFGQEPQGLNPSYITVIPQSDELFNSFNVKVSIHSKTSKYESSNINLIGKFTLGQKSNGISPSQEMFTLNLGSYSLSLPRGSFKTTKGYDKFWYFFGTIQGVNLKAMIWQMGKSNFVISLNGNTPKPLELKAPLTLELMIGDDQGTKLLNSLK